MAGTRGYITVGEFDDGRPGEMFVSIAKQGSTLRGVMDAFAVSISYGLQFGVPLKQYVRNFTNTTFAPAGITDDPDIRTASSLIDYIFRRLGKTYLSFDDQLELGLANMEDMPAGQTNLLTDAPAQAESPAVEQAMEAVAEAEAALTEAVTTIAASTADLAKMNPEPAKAEIPKTTTTNQDASAPMCANCGNVTQRSGSCYVCTSCGSTTGCS